uniref:Putative phosphoenolpyruvate phosphomutase n=1 Tax=uncultured marine thaumarchaeote SAT1000_07_E05 TaxID=1456364 RepID=A0A075I2N0_9ARCH|nr:putative phosphoenolpyruvate phosphomutase [uncultured marine thaumarchaeote SAT1000_07_E05]
MPTTYDSVGIDELIAHKIKMVIHANQTLRVAHYYMSKILKMNAVNSLSDIKEPMSSMEDIFEIQEMYDIKSKEKEIEEELKKLGYIS